MDDKLKDLKTKATVFVRKAKVQAADAVARTGNWVVRNKELVIVLTPLAIAGLKAGQTHLVSKRVKDERKRIDQTYYDPSTGFHWQLRRKATNADRAEISKRKKDGQEMSDILMQLKLI